MSETTSAAPPGTRWQYYHVTCETAREYRDRGEAVFNALGAEGWELTSTTKLEAGSPVFFIFRRAY